MVRLLPIPVPHELVLDRYGPYVVAFHAGQDAVPVFTEHGAWIGGAANPDAIGELIATYENGGPR